MDDLVRIAFFCKDKDTGRALRALVGIAQGQPDVIPVVNADLAKNGQLRQRTGGKASDMLLDYLKRNNVTEFETDNVKEWLVSNGYKASSAASTLEDMFKAKTIQRLSRGKYGLLDGRQAESESESRAGDQFVAYLKKKHQSEFNMDDLRAFLISIGRSEKSTYSAMQVMHEGKKIRQLGRNRYAVK